MLDERKRILPFQSTIQIRSYLFFSLLPLINKRQSAVFAENASYFTKSCSLKRTKSDKIRKNSKLCKSFFTIRMAADCASSCIRACLASLGMILWPVSCEASNSHPYISQALIRASEPYLTPIDRYSYLHLLSLIEF